MHCRSLVMREKKKTSIRRKVEEAEGVVLRCLRQAVPYLTGELNHFYGSQGYGRRGLLQVRCGLMVLKQSQARFRLLPDIPANPPASISHSLLVFEPS